MSRYCHEFRKDGKLYLVSYGYDRPLQEYFIHAEEIDPPLDPPSDDRGMLFAVSSYNTMQCHPDYPGKMRWSNSELSELFTEWGVPYEYRVQLALDLPF